MELLTRPQFYLDVAEEVEYLARKAGPKRPRAGMHATIQNLLRHPHLGRLRPDLTPAGLRSWRLNHFRRWLIFYLVRRDKLVLLRVRYGMMALPAVELES